MLLKFGPFTIDSKGMPALQNVSVYPPLSANLPVTVCLALVSDTRAAVEQWAKTLGAEVTETVNPLYEGDPTPLDIRATAEAQGVRVQVFTRAAAPAEALKGGAQ